MMKIKEAERWKLKAKMDRGRTRKSARCVQGICGGGGRKWPVIVKNMKS